MNSAASQRDSAPLMTNDIQEVQCVYE